MKKTIDEQIIELKSQINVLELQKRKLEILPNTKKLAEIIHDKRCRWNHTDGCGWFYESWENIGYSRQEYLKKADEVISKNPDLDFKQLLNVINSL